jgi:5'-3' exonuclease
MGIPSYFAYLMRHHKRILRAFDSEKVDNLYLDSNSIVYDVVRGIPFDVADTSFEDKLIDAVCAQLQAYLDLVRPRRVLVAFDGIPPMAKMKQQRDRRYKSQMRQEGWNTVQITPGTKFMKKLDDGIARWANAVKGRYEWFHVSGSDVPGEGEQKIFARMREVTHLGEKTMVYGLDSDLIVLALHHLERGEIELLREAPSFGKYKDQGLMVMDVGLLAEQIRGKLNGKLSDYVLLTLFMGNDFMPHFPSLNLRSNGFDIVVETYRRVVRPKERLFDGKIHWGLLKRFVQALARRESADAGREYERRNKVVVVPEEVNTPMLRRETEHAIAPGTDGWQARYYELLFPSKPEKKTVCEAYAAMLQWNMAYYTTGVPSWTLYYPFLYAPLLEDLDMKPCRMVKGKPANVKAFLEFIFPQECSTLASVPVEIEKRQPVEYWTFCTYLWESKLYFDVQEQK